MTKSAIIGQPRLFQGVSKKSWCLTAVLKHWLERFHWSCVALKRSARPREELHWHLKDMGDSLQSAGPDAVGAPLVFLYLLEAEGDSGTQLLAHCKHLAAHPHTPADMLVDGIWGHLSRQIVSRTAMADRSLKL